MEATKKQLYIATFLMEICYGLFILTASLMAVKVIDSSLVLGYTGVMHIGTRVIGNYIFGRLSDRIGRKVLMLFSCALTVLSFFMLGFNGMFYIFLAYFISGVANSIFWPVVEAWIGHGTSKENLLRFLGTFGLAFTGGVTIGNLSGGLFTKIGPEISIIFGGLTTLVVSWLIWKTGDQPTNREFILTHQSNTADTQISGSYKNISLKMRQRFLYIGWVANFATWTAIGINRFLFTKLAVVLGLTPTLIGFINATLYGCWFIMFAILMKYRGWVYRLQPLVAFQIMGCIALILIGFWPSRYTFFLSFGLFGFSAAMTYLCSMFYGQNAAEDKGHKSGLHEMILGLGMLLGPFCGGAVAELFSLQAPYLFSALTILLAIFTETIMMYRQRLQGI